MNDVRKTHDFIPWEDIGQIRLGVGETPSYLCFDFKKTDRTREDAPRLGGLGLLLKRARSLGDWNITLRLQIIEMNKANPNG